MFFPLVMEFILIIFSAVFLIFLIYVVIIGDLKGAPYVPSRRDKILKMMEMAELRAGEKAVDLGSGKGDLLIASARRGCRAEGADINPFLVWYTRFRVYKSGLKDLVLVHRRDFMELPLQETDVVFLYLLPKSMKKLKEKLKSELKPGARIISNTFPLSGWTPEKIDDKVYLYRIK